MSPETVINGYNYIPKENRKKILLLSDDLRLFSGVGVVSRQIVEGTAHRFNWVQLGAAIQHPEHGNKVDFSKELSQFSGVQDAQCIIYPNNGYGDPFRLRALLEEEKPDAVLHFTDPRFWGWLYDIEREIRQNIPILYYHVWDNSPKPNYNQSYYRSCNLIMCISKQTYNIVKQVLNEDKCKPISDVKNNKENYPLVSYVPHGINSKQFFPISEDNPGKNILIDENTFKSEFELMNEYKKSLGIENDNFVILYNNRNVRRKMTSDVVVAYEDFCNMLPKEQADKCVLILHTTAIDDNGTDLIEVCKNLCTHKVIFNNTKIDSGKLNYLYNISDVTINIASAEGFGLATAESLMAGTPILVSVTGGLQDQVGFLKNDNKLLSENDYNDKFLTNHFGKYKKHGDWANVVFPTACSMVGSPPTPYIYDDRVSVSDVTDELLKIYNLGKDKNKERGLKGREFLFRDDVKMTTEWMNKLIIHDIDVTLENFKTRELYTLHKI